MKPLQKIVRTGPKIRLGGRVKIHVIDSMTNEPVEFQYGNQRVKETPWVNNLILNNWLEKMNQPFNWFGGPLHIQLCKMCTVGTGTDDNKTDSGSIEASQTGTAITLTGSLAAVTAGRVIKWDSGEYSYIASGSGTSWVAAKSKSVASGQFTVMHSDESTLGTYVRTNTSTLSTTSTSWSGAGELTITRVYDFGVEGGAGNNYTEIGISPSTSAYNPISTGTDLWARVKLPSAVTVATGQQIRVTYALTFAVGPLVDTASSMVVTGWTTGAITERCVNFGSALNPSSNQDYAGALHPQGEADGNEQKSTLSLTSTSTIPALNVGGTVTLTGLTKEPSTTYNGSGTFTYTKTVTFAAGESNVSNINGIMIGTGTSPGFMCVFANTMEKVDTHTLRIDFEIQLEPEYA